jgi:molecular chaperone DnaK (HSP70)
MGIDLGSHEVKIATIKNSEFSIVLNEASKRKSVNALGFDGEERLFGEGASNLRGRIPKGVILNAHHLLGEKAGSAAAGNFGRSETPVPLEVHLIHLWLVAQLTQRFEGG